MSLLAHFFERMSFGAVLHEVVKDHRGCIVDYRILKVNQAFYEHTGMPEGAATNQLASQFYGADIPPYLETYARVVQTGEAVCFTVYFPPMDKHFEVEAFKLGAGQFATVFHDITQRVKEEQERDSLAAIVEATQDICVIKDLDLRVKATNMAYARAAGYDSVEQMVGKTDAEIFHVDPSTEPVAGYMADERLAQSLPPGEAVLREEAVLCKDGSVKTYLTRKFPVFDRNGQLIATANISNDISARKEVERQLTESQKLLEQRVRQRTADLTHANQRLTEEVNERRLAENRLEEAVRELEQSNAELEMFTYTVSHDLKGPLTTIKGFAGFIQQSAEQGDMTGVLSDLKRIDQAADRMHELLDDLLELSRVGRIIHPMQSVSLGELAHNAAKSIQSIVNEQHVDLQIASDLPVVIVDPIRMSEVYQNLFENAVKYAGDTRPCIRVGWQDDRQLGAVYWVEDTGIGIPEAYQQRVFNLFERLHSDVAGTGIGLAIVKRIIEFHRGVIWVESEGDGTGTRFCFTLGTDQSDLSDGTGSDAAPTSSPA